MLTRDGVSTARVNLGNLNLDATRVEVDVAGKGERVATVDQGDGTSALEGEPGNARVISGTNAWYPRGNKMSVGKS